MKYQLIAYIILCLFSNCTRQDNDTLESVKFVKYFGGAYDNLLADIVALPNDEFILLGSTQSFIEGIVDSTRIKPYQVLLLQTDKRGNEIWRKNISTHQKSEFGKTIKRTQNGGYVIVSTVQALNVSVPKFDNPVLNEPRSFSVIAITRTDSRGNILWKKTLGDSLGTAYQASDVIETQNGDFVVLGNLDSLHNDTFGQDMYIVRLTHSGSIIWEKKYGNDNFRHDFGVKLYEISTSAGEMLCLGSTQHSAADHLDYDIRLIKTDKLGNIIWETTYTRAESKDYPTDLIPSPQGYFITAFSQQDNIMLSQLIKVDRDGKFISRKNINFASSTMIGQATNSPRNTLITSGITFQGNIGSITTGFIVAELDFEGNIKFRQDYGATLNIADVSSSPTVTAILSDGSIAFGGTIRFGQNKMFALFKTDAQGKIDR